MAGGASRRGLAHLILVCPTSFKGTLTAGEASSAIASGVRAAFPTLECISMPVSDGGPGLIDALGAAGGGTLHSVHATDPAGRPVRARVLLVEFEGGTAAVVESADACGMHLVADAEADPMRLGTGGVGALIAAAAGFADTVVVGLGGSATVDGGAGMAAALGWRLLDGDGRALEPGGAALSKLARILPPDPEADPRTDGTVARRPRRVIALADVHNPLTGPLGAAAVFGPQKGASPANVVALDEGLARLAHVVRRDLGVDVGAAAGGGAAGGLGAGCAAFLGAELEHGADHVLRAVDFDRRLSSARLVVTGEGRWDAQSSMGKITGEVVERAARATVPVLLVVGSASGEVPPHVTIASADGALLDADALRELTARGLRSVAALRARE